MKRRHRRIVFVLFALASLSIAAALVLNAFKKNLVFYFTPTQVAAKQAPVARGFRLGGLVVQGSLHRDADGLTTRFTVSDTALSIPVIGEFFRIFSRKAAAALRRERSAPTERFTPIRFSRSTMRTTCRRARCRRS
jgi:hypothetical protein